jgi:hypothetical protein
MRVILVLAIIVGASLTTLDAQAQPCPESCVFGSCSTMAARDSFRVGDAPFGSPPSGWARYNLVTGFVYSQANSGFDWGMSAPTVARDRFVLVGPVSSQPIQFVVLLQLNGSASTSGTNFSSASAVGSLAQGSEPAVTASVSSWWSNPSDYLSTTLSLPQSRLVGESFEITYRTSAEATGPVNNEARITGVLSFSGLPPGHGIMSCQGFAGQVVPVLTRSWGALKVTYR